MDSLPSKEFQKPSSKEGGAHAFQEEGPLIEVGQWYYVDTEGDKDWLGCVVDIGSNYVEIENPWGSDVRVHLKDFEKECRRELNPEEVIKGKVAHYQDVVREKLAEIKAITSRLGLTPKKALAFTEDSGTALAVLSGTDNVKSYKSELIRAKEKELPALFEEVKKASEALSTWMSAQILPMKGMMGGMEDCIDEIEGRIFNVSLYAGLSEEVVEVRKGAPAQASEKLQILQRLHYMDEECLANYKHGGMTFKEIGAFDKWLAKPENFKRVLPFPRSMVAFRVRRNDKDFEWDGTLEHIIFHFGEKESNKATFLYIRNGEKLFRMGCDLEFGELIFPGKYEADLSEPMLAKMFAGHVDKIITKREHDEIVKEFKEKERKQEEWEKANPGEHTIHSPYGMWLHMDTYEPFNKSSVYYDDIRTEIENRVKYYNRIALIVQGLFDRSEVLHPHPPVHLWNPEGFSQAVELVYDGSNTLSYGEAPDIEAYKAACNASLKEGSITIGQDFYWQRKEAKKETRRMDNDWRVKGEWRPTKFKPYGNPGPGYLAKIARWVGRSRKAFFKWEREALKPRWPRSYGDLVPASVSVPDSHLFNVDAYKPGDYKQFFADPRTRAQYLRWAPMLIAAEEYYAGNLKVGPSKKD